MTGFTKAGLDHSEARTEEQKKLMEKIESDGVCPFCKENFTKYHPKPIIKETEYWFVTTNMSPYEGTTQHFLFVYKPGHILSPGDMTQEAAAELMTLVSEHVTSFDMKGGAFFMRFGEGGYSGSSVEHLHAQLIVGVHKDEHTESLKVKLGFKKAA